MVLGLHGFKSHSRRHLILDVEMPLLFLVPYNKQETKSENFVLVMRDLGHVAYSRVCRVDGPNVHGASTSLSAGVIHTETIVVAEFA